MNASLLFLSLAAATTAGPQDVLYDFYSTSCGPCQMMMPTVHKLHAQGYPIVKVNISERPDLAQRFGIDVVPTFVLVVGGRERQRISGWQDESTLRTMLAQIPQPQPSRTRSIPIQTIDEPVKPKPKWNFHLPLPSFPGKKNNVVEVDTVSQTSGSGSSGSRVRGVSVTPDNPAPTAGSDTEKDNPFDDASQRADSADAEKTGDSTLARMLASSVRIRVKDKKGAYFGSGVVIHSVPGKSVVLTCGHVLRDATRETQIEVDVLEERRPRMYHGTIVKFDLDADVGLLTIPSSPVLAACPVAAADESVRKSDTVISIGCSGGAHPSVERLRVTKLNRYLGPDTIECTGLPVQGRSGGGLFTTQGHVVGICTNADPVERRGVYAGLNPIHGLLHVSGLDELIPAAARDSRTMVADAQADREEPDTAGVSPASKLEAELAQMSRTQPKRSADTNETAMNLPAGAGDDSSTKDLEGAEVICIIRSANQAKGASRVVIINRASKKFLSYLTGEAKDQLQPMMAKVGPDHSQTLDGVPTQNAAQLRQIAPSWKPTKSAKSNSTPLPVNPHQRADEARLDEGARSEGIGASDDYRPPVEPGPARRYMRSVYTKD
jgi:thiol-disulfide isomerase/thioredoxin